MKKYEFTGETKLYNDFILYRIRAIRNFGKIKAGDLGGWIEHEENLSHNGNCWVADEAKVFEKAVVYEDAHIYDNAEIFGKALIYGNAKVYDNAQVYDSAGITDYTHIYDCALIHGNATILGNSKIYNTAQVFEQAIIRENAQIFGNVIVRGNAHICGNAKVKSINDYIIFKNFWSSGRFFTWTRSNNKWAVGCFYGTGKKLIKKAYGDSETSGREYERIVKYVESIIKNI